jgi:hypothetical protein
MKPEFGFDPTIMPTKPTAADRCVYEGFRALSKNRPVIIPGRVNRIMKRNHSGRCGASADGQDARQDRGEGRYAKPRPWTINAVATRRPNAEPECESRRMK